MTEKKKSPAKGKPRKAAKKTARKTPAKAAAKAPAKPRLKFGKLRALFSKPGVAMSIGEISGVLGIQTHSACAAISVLGNPAKTEEPLRIILDRSTGLG